MKSMNSDSAPATLRRLATALVAVLCLAWTSAPAAQTTPGDDKGGPRLATGGEDGVGTLPFTATTPTGLVLAGTLPDLLATVLSANAAPQDVIQLPNDRWAVLFGHGSLVDLDRAALAVRDVRAYYSVGGAFDGGRAILSNGTASLATIELDASVLFEVPLRDLYGPASAQSSLVLDAFGYEGLRHRTVFAPQGTTLRIGQMTIDG